MKRVRVRRDDALGVRIVDRTPLYYEEGGDPSVERPPFVRAGSSLARLPEVIAVFQDDARFGALIDPVARRARSVMLPSGPGGHRAFDVEHGDRSDKLDLEACASIPGRESSLLVAFGSGTKPSREQIALLEIAGRDVRSIEVSPVPAFYAALRAAADFAGSELNLEGAIYLGYDTLRLFQRGNGRPGNGREPVDATGDIAWDALRAHLHAPDSAEPPAIHNIVQYDLGDLDGVRLTFSDAEPFGQAVLFSASAEASGGSGHDGRVNGSVLGVIAGNTAHWAKIHDAAGRPFGGKIEGLTWLDETPRHVYFVDDNDSVSQPSSFYRAELTGNWPFPAVDGA